MQNRLKDQVIHAIRNGATILFLAYFILLHSASIQAAPGDTKWVFNAGAAINYTPAIGPGGWVIFGSANRKVYAVDGRTGEKQWEFVACGEVNADPAIGLDGTVYIGSADGHLYALDGYTGTKKWDLNGLNANILSNPAAPAIGPDGTVYVGGAKGVLYALDGATGAQKWATPANSHILGSTPAIGADGTIFVAIVRQEDNPPGITVRAIQALDAATGSEKWIFEKAYGWEYSWDSTIFSPVIGSDGTVYFCSAQSAYALDGKTGKELWSWPGDYQTGFSGSPTLDNNGTLYIGSNLNRYEAVGGQISALDAKTGLEKWRYETGFPTQSSPAVSADGTLYIGEDDGHFFALDAASGIRKWSMRAGGSIGAPAIGQDGTVYVTSADGKLYALEGTASLAAGTFSKYRGDARNSGSMFHTGAPTVMKFLTNQWAGVGFPYALEAVANGQPPLSYSWYYNGTRIEGETNSVLQFASFESTNAGGYHVQVTNAFGTADSREITLTPAAQIDVEIGGPGQVVRTPNTSLVPMGTDITLTAQPNGNHRFLSWNGGLQDTNPIIHMTASHSMRLRASFAWQPGEVKWSMGLFGSNYTSPFNNDLLGINGVSNDGSIYAGFFSLRYGYQLSFDSKTGAKKWATYAGPLDPSGNDLMLGENDAVYARRYGNIVSLANDTGNAQWTYSFGWSFGLGTIFSFQPDGTIYGFYNEGFGITQTGSVTVVNGDLGVKKWAFNTPAGMFIAANGGMVYISSSFAANDPAIFALNATNGSTNWVFHSAGSVNKSILGNDGILYLYTDNKKLYAVNASNGSELWDKTFDASITSLVQIKGAVICSVTNRIQAFDPKSGETLWDYAPTSTISTALFGGPADTICFGGDDKKYHALEGATGTPRWDSITLPVIPPPPAVGPDGTMYFAMQKTLYALEGNDNPQSSGSTNAIAGKLQLGLSQDQTMFELSTLSLTFKASGNIPDTNALRYSLVSAPEGMTLDSISGQITWTPTAAQSSTNYVVVVRLTDTSVTNSSVVKSFTINVRDVNHPPQLTTEPRFFTVESGQTLVLTNTAVDPDGLANFLSYSLSTNSPAGMQLDTYSGVLSWTAPVVTNALTNVFSITVSDNGHPMLSDSAVFTVVTMPPPPSLRFEHIQRTDSNSVSLTWASAPGTRYQLQSTDSMEHPTWIDLGEAIRAQDATTTQVDDAITTSQRYYRVTQLPDH